MEKIMKKSGKQAAILVAVALSLVMAFPAFSAHGVWQQEGVGWKYQNADGSYVMNGWIEEEGNWYRFDGIGFMQTGWVKENLHWYYMEPNGVMVRATTKNVAGTDYKFDDTGAWLDPNATEVRADATLTSATGGFWEGNVFRNPWSNYQIEIPADYVKSEKDPEETSEIANLQDFLVSSASGDVAIGVTYVRENTVTPNQFLNMCREEIIETQSMMVGEVTAIKLGEYEFQKLPMLFNAFPQDIYCRRVDDGSLMILITAYTLDARSIIDEILGSIKKLR